MKRAYLNITAIEMVARIGAISIYPKRRSTEFLVFKSETANAIMVAALMNCPV